MHTLIHSFALGHSNRVEKKKKDNAYPIILPVFSHTLVAHSPYPRDVAGRGIGGVLTAIIAFTSWRLKIHGHSVASGIIIRLVPKLILEILFACIRRVYFRGPVLLRTIMPAIRSIVRLPISGYLRLDVIRVSVTTETPSLRLGLAFIIGIGVVTSDRITCTWLGKCTLVILVRLRGSLIALAVVLILMRQLLITLEPWRFALLRMAGGAAAAAAVVLRISSGTAIVRRPSTILVFLRVPRRWLISTATFLISVVKINFMREH